MEGGTVKRWYRRWVFNWQCVLATQANCWFTADTNVGWWHRSNYQDFNELIPLLRQEQNGKWKLAGVTIDNISKPISDEGTKDAIKTAMESRTFHVSYCIKSTDMDEGTFVALR
jgi:hypothetical protein